MERSVCYFVNERGENPVLRFIEELPVKEQAKILAYMRELKKQGHHLRRPMADYLGEGIYELRPKDNRVFYFFFLGENVVLLHAIRKKTDKIPQGDLDICQRRRRLVEVGGMIEKVVL